MRVAVMTLFVQSLRSRLQAMSVIERRALIVGGMAAAALLTALVTTCQESVHRGQRLRAEQWGQGAQAQPLASHQATLPMTAADRG